MTTGSMPLKDVRDRLSDVVDRVDREHDRVVITKHGRPAAVVMSVADLESLEESVEIMSRPDLMNRIADSLEELERGDAEVLSKEQALGHLRP
ncbi:type II toxin-antitoxin system Phd/YefM family antitoxin [Georgenia sunbinii]|uniref:type II toxin-antitoxin system Phd/YefM family antitoxin n=1 Tax=Georgenia sunbinii TaxID=3117728 RepID=UPI002F26ADDD